VPVARLRHRNRAWQRRLAVADTKTDLIANMKWMNEPASSEEIRRSLLVRSRAKTDFWRKTCYGYITDSGHFFYVPVSGDFPLRGPRKPRVCGVIRWRPDAWCGRMQRTGLSAEQSFSMASATPAWFSHQAFRTGPRCPIYPGPRRSGGERYGRKTRLNIVFAGW
jgi:hypothetical protein